MTKQLWALGAVEIGERLRSGELTSEALVQALWARAEAVDGKINGWAVKLREASLRDARALDEERAAGRIRGPLHGIPLSVKENIALAGTDQTAGAAARRGRPAEVDAAVVALAREGGAVLLGKGNVPQTLMASETTNRVYGTTNNPWALDRSPGGSSGGEAALLATGQTPLAIGTDVGGSIRLPAAFCGVAGLKPTWNAWSNLGSYGMLAGQPVVRPQMGPMARSVADLALLFRAIPAARLALLDPEVPPLPAPDPASLDVSKLRVGVYDDDGFVRPAASVRRAVREAADMLRDAGATVVSYRPPDAEEVFLLAVAAFSSDGFEHVRQVLDGEPVIAPLALFDRTAGLPRSVRAGVARALELAGERRLAATLRSSGARSAAELWRLSYDRTERARAELARWRADGLDAVLCPAFATPAPQQGATADFSTAACYTIRFNALNFPAGVVPVTRVRAEETERAPEGRPDRVEKRARSVEAGSAGLPIGVQVAAAPYREDVVLALLAAIEQRARARIDFPLTPVEA